MKNIQKLFGITALMAVILLCLAFTACGTKGGTIEVTNGLQNTIGVLVVKGDINVVNSDMIEKAKNGTQIRAGESNSFSFEEDGAYVVIPVLFVETINQPAPQPALLLGGNVVKVTIK